jgi:hypothetical protein
MVSNVCFRTQLMNLYSSEWNDDMKMNYGKRAILACVMAVSASIVGLADDAPESGKKKHIVIVETLSNDVIEKIREQLKNANISDETRDKVLKRLEAALPKQDAKANEEKAGAKKSTKTVIETANSDGKNHEEVSVTIIAGDADEAEVKLEGLGRLPGLGKQLKARVIRPLVGGEESFRIGVACQQSDDEESEKAGNSEDKSKTTTGLMIDSVLEDSPAASAGIKKGDILLTVNSKEIKTVSDLTEVIQEAGKKDKEISLEISRNDKKQTVSVKPKKMKSSDLEMDNINLNLNLPSGGFVLDEDSMKKWQEYATKWKGVGPQGGTFSFAIPGNNNELKKEVDQLKLEIAELKKLIRELIEKK